MGKVDHLHSIPRTVPRQMVLVSFLHLHCTSQSVSTPGLLLGPKLMLPDQPHPSTICEPTQQILTRCQLCTKHGPGRGLREALPSCLKSLKEPISTRGTLELHKGDLKHEVYGCPVTRSILPGRSRRRCLSTHRVTFGLQLSVGR